MRPTLLLLMLFGATLGPAASPSPAIESAERPSPGVTLDPVRPRWPIAREPSGYWGVFGEAVVRHTFGHPVDVTAVAFDLFDARGRLLAHALHDTPQSVGTILMVSTTGDGFRWKPAGSTEVASGEAAVAFLTTAVATRPAWASVTVTFGNEARRRFVVPLDVFQPRQLLRWPTRPGAEPWVATGTAGTPHHWRGGALLHGGSLSVSQRFAIDLRQIDAAYRTHPEAATGKEEYYAWGEEVLSMGRGRVVAVANEDPDFEIGETIPSTQHPAGNYVVVQYDRALFGVYAHLQRGTVEVSVGDRVERGQRLALVGNSGNTTEPHLHVHFADSWRAAADPGESFFASQGVPTLFWGATVIRDGVLLPLRGSTPVEFDIIVPGRTGR